MKYALSSRQSEEYLKKADEIRVQYKDRDIIYDFIEKYPTKTIILEIPYYVEEESIDFQEIKTFSKLVQSFICRISRYEDINKLRDLDVRWYYGMIVDKWEDLISLSNTDTEYVLIGGDLFFNLPKVKDFGIPIRAVPNVSTVSPLASNSAIDFDISIVGDWFHPNAKHIYEQYIAAIEFEGCSLQQERAFYRIWSNDGWPGDLCTIISGLNTHAEGRLLNMDWFSTSRIDCNRSCLMRDNIGCQLCYRQFALANYDKLKDYKESAHLPLDYNDI